MEKPSPSSVTIKELPGYVELMIPAKKNWLLLVLPLFFVCFWWLSGGGEQVVNMFNKPFTLSVDLFWVVWVAAIVVVLAGNLWWLLAGREIITATKDTLKVKKRGQLFARTKIYKLRQARYFRIDDGTTIHTDGILDNNPPDQEGKGIICFEYGIKTIHFGENISADDGTYILQLLKERKILTDRNFLKELA